MTREQLEEENHLLLRELTAVAQILILMTQAYKELCERVYHD